MFERVEIGDAPDDGAGDSLREAFEKLNRNFGLLADRLAEISAELADLRAQEAPDWPGSFAPRHVAERPPDQPPPLLGAVWVDASAGAVYVSAGTGAVSDWVKLATSRG